MQYDDDGGRTIRALEHSVTEIRTMLNNGLKTMVQEQKAELTIVKSDIQLIRDLLTSHVAKEDVVYEIFKRVMNTDVSITGTLIALLLSIIGYLLACSSIWRLAPTRTMVLPSRIMPECQTLQERLSRQYVA